MTKCSSVSLSPKSGSRLKEPTCTTGIWVFVSFFVWLLTEDHFVLGHSIRSELEVSWEFIQPISMCSVEKDESWSASGACGYWVLCEGSSSYHSARVRSLSALFGFVLDSSRPALGHIIARHSEKEQGFHLDWLKIASLFFTDAVVLLAEIFNRQWKQSKAARMRISTSKVWWYSGHGVCVRKGWTVSASSGDV